MIIEGEAGLMHMSVERAFLYVRMSLHMLHSTGEPDRPPVKVGVAATDIATGLYAHGAIMAALISRQQTNQGVWIDCNLFESQVITIFYIRLSKNTLLIINCRLLDWQISLPTT